VTSDVAEALGLDKVRGALVVRVAEGGPAAKAGLKAGQVVVAIDGIPVEHPDALGYRLTTTGLGKKVTLSIRENGRESQIAMTLAGAPETTPRDERLIEGGSPFAGAKIANLSPKLAYDLRMPSEVTGVVITEIAPGSPASRLGFAPHDIIISVNGVNITSTAAMAKAAGEDPGFWRVEVEREGQRIRQIFR
jgi:S1-C subfamily serine protease